MVSLRTYARRDSPLTARRAPRGRSAELMKRLNLVRRMAEDRRREGTHGNRGTPASASSGEETLTPGETDLDSAMCELVKALARKGRADIAGVRQGTGTDTRPLDTKTGAVGRSVRACVARKSNAEPNPSRGGGGGGGGGITRRKG